MAYDEGLAEAMREDLGASPGLSEKRMFGGLCFLLDGNMICGLRRQGAMYRVGKAREADALMLEGVAPMTFTGRRMGGMVDLSADACDDDAVRAQLTAMALSYAASLPPKA